MIPLTVGRLDHSLDPLMDDQKARVLSALTNDDRARVLKKLGGDKVVQSMVGGDPQDLLVQAPITLTEILGALTKPSLRNVLKELGRKPGRRTKDELIVAICDAVAATDDGDHDEPDSRPQRTMSPTLNLAPMMSTLPKSKPIPLRRWMRLIGSMNRLLRDEAEAAKWLRHEYGDYFPDHDQMSPQDLRDIARVVKPVVMNELPQHVSWQEVELIRPFWERRRRGSSHPPPKRVYSSTYPFGYPPITLTHSDGTEQTIPASNSLEAYIVRFAFLLASTGSSSTKIVEMLEHLWMIEQTGKSRPGEKIARLLRNPRYIGESKLGSYTPLVTKELFDLAGAELERNRPGSKYSTGGSFHLRSKLRCRRCGHVFKKTKSRGKRKTYWYYKCTCRSGSMSADNFENAVLISATPELFGDRLRVIAACLDESGPEELSDGDLDSAADRLHDVILDPACSPLENLAHLMIDSVEVEKGPGRLALARVTFVDRIWGNEEETGTTSLPKPPWDTGQLPQPPPPRRTQRHGPPQSKPWSLFEQGSKDSTPVSDERRKWYQSHFKTIKDDLLAIGEKATGKAKVLKKFEGRVRKEVLTRSEFAVLVMLVKHTGHPLTVVQIAESLGTPKSLDSIRTFISRIRHKVDSKTDEDGGWRLVKKGEHGSASYYIPLTPAVKYRILV